MVHRRSNYESQSRPNIRSTSPNGKPPKRPYQPRSLNSPNESTDSPTNSVHRFRSLLDCYEKESQEPEKDKGFSSDSDDVEIEEEDDHQDEDYKGREPDFFPKKNWDLRSSKDPLNNNSSFVPKKNWDLRPRKTHLNNKNSSQSGEGSRNAKLKLLVFSVSLTNEEINQDFLDMTGSLPPKKPKKRPNIVQKYLDATFPGMNLNVKLDSYCASDPPEQR